jgi:beta-phosphoglucomutase-like phosphatase (HAD superfamily)
MLGAVGVKPEECVLIEDSMKNIRQAKEIGMKTVLVIGKGRLRKRSDESNEINDFATAAAASEATKPSDAHTEDDPSVDICIETVNELRSALPGLWHIPTLFNSL